MLKGTFFSLIFKCPLIYYSPGQECFKLPESTQKQKKPFCTTFLHHTAASWTVLISLINLSNKIALKSFIEVKISRFDRVQPYRDSYAKAYAFKNAYTILTEFWAREVLFLDAILFFPIELKWFWNLNPVIHKKLRVIRIKRIGHTVQCASCGFSPCINSKWNWANSGLTLCRIF